VILTSFVGLTILLQDHPQISSFRQVKLKILLLKENGKDKIEIKAKGIFLGSFDSIGN